MRHLLLVAFFFTPHLFANYYMFNPTPVMVTVSPPSVQLMPQNTLREYLLVINTGANTAYINFGQKQSATQGVVIPAGGNYEPLKAPSNSVWGTTAAGLSASLVIIEGQ